MTSALELAQEDRRRRGDETIEQTIDGVLDRVGLSEAQIKLSTADVSPADRQKLKGILARLAKQKHPFTQCMRDLRKHQPGWSEERRKKTCAVLKQISHPASGSKTSLSTDEGACALLDERAARLLDMADITVLEEATA